MFIGYNYCVYSNILNQAQYSTDKRAKCCNIVY